MEMGMGHDISEGRPRINGAHIRIAEKHRLDWIRERQFFRRAAHASGSGGSKRQVSSRCLDSFGHKSEHIY